MRYLLFDDENRANLLPLAYTRPVAEFRIGILTIAEKWSRRMPNEAVFGGYVTETYLQGKYSSDINEEQLINKIKELNTTKNIFQGREIKRSIFVKNRLINLILK